MRSTVQGPSSIITENLTFYFDAANQRSYRGTGASWSDLTPGGRTTTLSNSPTYTTEFNGGLQFSTASLQSFSIPAVPMTTESFAVDIWVKAGLPAVTGTGYNGILSCGDIWADPTNATRGWGIGMRQTSTLLDYGLSVTSSAGGNIVRGAGPTLTTGTIYHFFMQRNTTLERIELYINGSLYSTANISNTGSVNSTNAIGTATWLFATPYNNNTYYTIKMYRDKVFTDSEIQQNFNASRYRFGL